MTSHNVVASLELKSFKLHFFAINLQACTVDSKCRAYSLYFTAHYFYSKRKERGKYVYIYSLFE